MIAQKKVEWKPNENGELVAMIGDEPATWAALPGSQDLFLDCPIFEVLYEGNRGLGKTDCLLMDFGQHVGLGFGIEWRGILFRQTYPQLADVITKTKKWFTQIWPRAKFNEQKTTWTWPGGETLRLRFMKTLDDYWQYHGHSYPWIAWEELTTWPDSKCYTKMMSLSRSTVKGIPLKYRSTTNPYGPGHSWVKERFRLPLPPRKIVGPVIRDSKGLDGTMEPDRVAIHGHLYENIILLQADPGYIDKIRAAASNSSELDAWLHGSWDIVAGGMFTDVWRPEIHVLPNFPAHEIPRGWRIDRSYDHGQSKPFSVGWWAESNGEPMILHDQTGRRYVIGPLRGDLIRIAEWYGCTGSANEGVRMLSTEIARGIVEREADWGLTGRVRPGAADSSIFDNYEPGKSVSGDMAKHGVVWIKADKGPGSRKQGWQQMRAMMKGALPGFQGIRESPGLFVCERCDQFRRTVPTLPRLERDLDDVDTDAEDHIGDEVRYRIRAKDSRARSWRWQ